METAPPLTSYLRGALKPEYPILGRISEIDHIMGEMCSQDERTFVLIEGEKGKVAIFILNSGYMGETDKTPLAKFVTLAS